MELSQNLKKTEIGLIPNEWSISCLDEVSSIGSGKRLPLGKSLSDKVTPHPYIRVTDMNRGSVELSGIKYVPEDIYPSIKNYRIFCNDIFISVAGNRLGQVGKIPKELDGANLTENANRIYNLKCSQDYLLHVMASPIIQKVIAGTITVGAQPKLALTRIRKFKIPLPPTTEEQQAIADVLSNTDGYIESLGKLIAKKRLIRKSLLQELFTPKKDWKPFRLGDCAILKARIGWQGLTTSEYLDSGDYGLVTGTDFKSGKIDWDNCHYVTKDRYDQDRNIQLKENDVLVTKDGTIGKVALISSLPQPTTLNSGVFVVRPINNAFDTKCFYYLLSSIHFDEFLAQLAAGSTISHLYQKDFTHFRFKLPGSDAQEEIGSILFDVDSDIEHHEKKLKKARLLKQGMMHELLTGRIRLV
ncbi:MAG: restriction endonuclease subunit S [Oligoflexia bacterium]|nr:restriction endonuclease subunit S [Oligoflexia bacterium]